MALRTEAGLGDAVRAAAELGVGTESVDAQYTRGAVEVIAEAFTSGDVDTDARRDFVLREIANERLRRGL